MSVVLTKCSLDVGWSDDVSQSSCGRRSDPPELVGGLKPCRGGKREESVCGGLRT